MLYWRWLKVNRKQTTANRRLKLLKDFSKSVPQNLKIKDLRGHHVQKWVSRMKYLKGKKNKNKALSPTTINGRITTILTVINWAVRQGYVDANRCKIDKPTPKIRQEFIPADLWLKVVNLASGQEFRDFLIVMLSSGARPQEMFRFEARHFDKNRFVLLIDESKGEKRSRVVYLPDDALLIVKRLMTQHPEGKLFRNSNGIPWCADSIKCRFDRLKRKANMPKLCATTLRHSFAHFRLSSGQDHLTVAKLLGHVDTRMLATRYGHLDSNTDFMANAANQIAFPKADDQDTPEGHAA